MQYVTANLSGKVRRSTLNGREHIVVPLTMIVPGVLNGSDGPIYYPPEENRRDPSAWNHMPIVVYHPKRNGRAISARDPEVLDKSAIGIVLSSEADPRIVAEGWFDIEKTRKVDQRVLANIEAGIPIELSTGLGMDKVPAPPGANYNGVPYDYIATNYRPDHLAVLPDQVGACSIKDGCGVLVNEMSHEQLSSMLEMELRKSFKQDEPGAYIVQVFDGEFIYEQGGKLYKLSYTKSEDSVKLGKKPEQVIRKVSFDPVGNVGDAVRWTGVTGETDNHTHSVELDENGYGYTSHASGHYHKVTDFKVMVGDAPYNHTHTVDRSALVDSGDRISNVTKKEGSETLSAGSYAYVPDKEKPSTWKLRIDDKAHVAGAVAALGKGFRGQKVSIPAGAMAGVKAKVRAAWLKFNPGKTTKDLPPVIANQQGDQTMDREKTINYLIANCGCWEEDDREVLNNFPDEKLESLKTHVEQHVQLTNNAKPPKKMTAADLTDNELQAELDRRTAPTGNTSSQGNKTGESISDKEVADIVNSAKVKTYDDWMNEAPPEVKEVVENAKKLQDSQKLALVRRLVANSKAADEKLEAFTRNLLKKSMEELQEMAEILPQAHPERQPVPSYFGASVPPTINLTDEEEDDYLDSPVINWTEWQEQNRKGA